MTCRSMIRHLSLRAAALGMALDLVDQEARRHKRMGVVVTSYMQRRRTRIPEEARAP